MNNLIKKQLEQVQIADLTNFNEDSYTYIIPQKKTIKIEKNKAYLIFLNDSFFYNTTLRDNWNKGFMPKDRYLKCEVDNVAAKMIKITGIGYDMLNKKDTYNFWNGWVTLDDIQVLQKL